MAKIVITGGAGFIGAHVAQSLLARGEDVWVVDDFNDRYDPRLKEARVPTLLAKLPSDHLIRGDIRDRALIDKLFGDEHFEHVIHLAAWAAVQPSIANPHIYGEVNMMGTLNILEAARRSGVKTMVFASTSSVYGGLERLPFTETDEVTRPLSPYAATKVAGEVLCATWHSLYQIPTTCLRFFTVYGPWGRPEMALFQFSESIRLNKEIEMRGATTQRDFTYIDDIVQGVIGALDHPHSFELINLGNHYGVPLPRFIKAIETALGKTARVKEVPLPTGDIPRTLADITKAKKLLGYNPTTSIEVGVQRFVEWYQDWYVPRFG